MAHKQAFLEAVEATTRSWPALRMAVEQGFGGEQSREKAEWLPGAISSWMLENGKLL